jgi:phosphatidate phosphatase APP1
VLTVLRRASPRPEQHRLTNLRQMLSLFLTREVAGVAISAGDRETRTDAEGYFTLELPRGDAAPGWHQVPVAVAGAPATEVKAPVLVPDPRARWFVISDIDDTVLKTGAYSLARNLWTSLTGNALTREVFPDAIRLLERLHEQHRNPVYYVSSSPWNLHDFLDRIFRRHGLVRGPMSLQDFGIAERSFIKASDRVHKGRAIDALMAAHPDLPAVLVGDTGQHDPQVYAAVAARWPGRVRVVLLREPRPRRSRADDEALAALTEAGVPVLAGPDFRAALERLEDLT